MPKLIRVDPGLFLDPKSRVYYVRKYVSGHGELCRSTGERNLYKARIEQTKILSEWLGAAEVTKRVPFEHVAEEVRGFYKLKAPATLASYEHHLDSYLMPFFKTIPLDEVGLQWARYKAHSRRLKPNRKLKHDRKHLIYILRFAENQELLDKVPHLEIDARDRNSAQGREFTNDEIERLLSNADRTLALLIEMQFKTGARRGEVRQLKWEYIDFERGIIHVPAHICKTRYDREYPLPVDISEKLIARRKSQVDKKRESEFVFPHRNDRTKSLTSTDKPWQRLKIKAKVKGKQHWLRHTAATRFVRAGISPQIIQNALGMSSKIMSRVYLHVNDEDLQKMREVMNDSLTKTAQSIRKNSESQK